MGWAGLGRGLCPGFLPAGSVSQANTLRSEAAQLAAADGSVSGITAGRCGDPLTLFQVL